MKKSPAEKIILWCFFGIFALYVATLLFPFLWLIVNSLKENTEFYENVWALPRNWLFKNFGLALSQTVNGYNFLQILGNTLFLSSVLTFVGTAFPTMAAYVCSKYRFRLRSLCMLLTVIMISVPAIGGTAAAYKLFKAVGIFDSYLSIILMGSAGFGFSFMLVYGAFSAISWTYAEAGFVDGASDFRVFWNIMTPMAWPVILTLVVLGFIGCWNDYFNVYMFAPSRPTLGVGIKQLSENLSGTGYPQLFALMIVSIVPAIVLYALFQKPIMNSTSSGGIKE